jgi:hypothetical protein
MPTIFSAILEYSPLHSNMDGYDKEKAWMQPAYRDWMRAKAAVETAESTYVIRDMVKRYIEQVLFGHISGDSRVVGLMQEQQKSLDTIALALKALVSQGDRKQIAEDMETLVTAVKTERKESKEPASLDV